ncbi:MAG: ROK family protein [Planctomycetaceae bacterium]|nr:ROK family protein [Planctomycetales bacterium]MCB9926983.1 ROK family protein [Planctomycetaceae bacterium]
MSSAEKKNYWVGLDLGGTKMLATVYDADFKPIGRRRRRTKGTEGADSVTARMIRTLRDAIEDAKLTPSEVSGIGIGIPGPVDQEKGVVLEAVNLSWENVQLAKLVKSELDLPVVVLNDVDAGVYGEYRFGAAKSARTAIGIFPGTGIGGGCVYDGQIIRGKRNSCMEIGHISVTPEGQLCGCGLRGCLETEASRLAISAEVAKAAYRGEAPYVLASAGTTLADIRSGILAEAIAAGDKVVEQIVRRAARILGTAVAASVHLLGPDVIVLGGGLVEAMPELYIETVASAARKAVMPSFVDTFKVVAAKLGDDAGVLGCAAWAQKTFSE